MSLKLKLSKLGKLWSQYFAASQSLAYLTEIIPSFMREPFNLNAQPKHLLLVSIGFYEAKTEAIYAKVFQELAWIYAKIVKKK